MPLPLILLAAGTAISAWSAYEQGQQQAHAANDANTIRNLEAQEVLDRLNINKASIWDEANRFKTRQSLGIAASGRLSNDSTLSLLEDTNAQAVRAVYNAEKQAVYRAQSLQTEGMFAQQRGQEAARAGKITAFGTLLTGGLKAYPFMDEKSIDNSSSSLTTFDLGPNGNSGGSWSQSYKGRY